MPGLAEVVHATRAVFNGGRTQSYEWRRDQLLGVIRFLEEERTAILAALKQDLNKPELEAVLTEIDFVRNDAVHVINHFKDWMKPQKVAKNLMTMMDDAYIRSEPFGVVLIIGAWNYPIQLTLGPMVGALAAGNCVILKPSEVSSNTAKLLEQTFPKYFDKECVRVVNGGVAETTELLKEKFDYIMYTGNGAVARVVYEAAAKHLTPVTLELGGKSPVYIDDTSDLDVVSRRLMWGKFMNAGQTCIAPDYILCSKELQTPLVEKFRSTLNAFYGSNPQESDSYARIVNARHFGRVNSLLTSTNGTVALGGRTEEKSNYIEPTVLVDVKLSDPVMKDEVFGPVLPLVTVKDVDEAIDIINGRDKPLALYVFSKNKAVVDKIVSSTSSGGVTINDTLMHPSLATLPFGGVGGSGMGAYHGKFSFDTFSHKRSVLARAQAMEKMNDVRYPPYTSRKSALIHWVMKTSPKTRLGVILSYVPVLIIGVLLGVLFKALL